MTRASPIVAEDQGQTASRAPEATRQALLEAGRDIFARLGLHGARVDAIATAAGVNKQLIYYHFGDKEGLYKAVLEATYAEIRARERALDLAALTPVAAMETLVGFTFDYLVENPSFVALLSDENTHRAEHLKRSPVLDDLRSPFVGFIDETLRRGREAGVFRGGVDPTQFYISLAGLCYFYHANIHTLSVLFGRNLGDAEALAERRAHILQFVMGFLTSHWQAHRRTVSRHPDPGKEQLHDD
jgi:TetR/AcrR family transcriptional regulator